MNKINNTKTGMICFLSALAIQATNALPDFSQMANRSRDYMTRMAKAAYNSHITVQDCKDCMEHKMESNFPRTHQKIVAGQKFMNTLAENNNLKANLMSTFKSICPYSHVAVTAVTTLQEIRKSAGEDSIKDCLTKQIQSQYPGLYGVVVAFQELVKDIEEVDKKHRRSEAWKNMRSDRWCKVRSIPSRRNPYSKWEMV